MKLKNKLEVEETLEVGVIPNATTSNFSVVFETAGLFQRRQVGSIINKNDNEYLPSVSNAFPSSVFVVNASTTHANPNLTVSFVNQVAGTVFAAPQSLNGTPAFRMLQDSDLSQTSFNNKANIDGSNIPIGTKWQHLNAGGLGDYTYVDTGVGSTFERVMVWDNDGWFYTDKSGFASWLGIENIGLHKTKEIVGFSNYRRSVIPLVSLDNTDISFNSYFFGSVYAKRGNVIGHKINKIDISIGKYYNSDIAVGNVNFITNEGISGNYFKPVIFFLNGIKYFGIEIGTDVGNYEYAYVDGITNDWSHIDRIDYLNTQNSTILNQEVYDSLEDYEFTNDSYNKIEEFLHKVKAEAFIKNGGDGTNLLLDDGNVKAVSDFALASSIITPNDGLLTISTSSDLTGGGTFSADQATASNVNIGLSAGTLDSLALADTALQSGDDISELNNDAGYITSSSLANYLPLAGGVMVGNSTIDWAGAANLSTNGNRRIRLTNTQTFIYSLVTGGTSGIIFRPQGESISTGEVSINGDGQINTSNHGTSSDWYQAYQNMHAQVNLTQGTGIGITGIYPNLTITNTAPNINQTLNQSGQVVTLSNGGGSFTLPTVNNGTFQVQGVGSLTGNGSTSANASANTAANLDLTTAEKNRIQQGVDAYNELPELRDGVTRIHRPTATPFTLSTFTKKKTIVNYATGVSGATLTLGSAPYDGYELAINGCGEWGVTILGNIMDACGNQAPVSVSNNSLFWWDDVNQMWYQAI